MNPRATTTERDQTRDTTRALTEREVADMLGLSVATLRAWRHRGKGPRFLRAVGPLLAVRRGGLRSGECS